LAQSRPQAARPLIAAVATPQGRGAVGIVRLSGHGAAAAAQTLLDAGPLIPRRPTLRWLSDREGRVDRVLATFFPAGASYSGEETIEISAHGSPYILERILQAALACGARTAGPGEFTQRAYENGRLDLTQAEAVGDLIAARSALAHRAAVAQLSGGLAQVVEKLRGRIVDIRAWVEADLDHPDEDIPVFGTERCMSELSTLLDDIATLSASHDRGRAARAGVCVAIVGRPNAGKSSLLNALAGSQRAIVADTAGTTRDTVEARLEIAGLETRLIDTAGLRSTPANPIEAEGHRRAGLTLDGADLALLVCDQTRPLETELLADARARCPRVIPVLNKSDLAAPQIRAADIEGAVEVSALKGSGIPELLEHMSRTLTVEEDSSALLISTRHHDALLRCSTELEAARAHAQGTEGGELIAARLQSAGQELDAICGRTTSDDVLGEIFSRFCIGK
jgi:tRNA modification GTPase